jgi:hypothetical protein
MTTHVSIVSRAAGHRLDVRNPRNDVVEASKDSLRRTMESYRMVDEKESTYNGMVGWRIESEGVVENHDTYWVQWVFATNDVGYLLSTWAPSSIKPQLKEEADRLFGDFEITPPQRDVTIRSNP